jgi:hypothetical protein
MYVSTVMYNVQYTFCLTINMLILHSKEWLKLLRKIITVYCEHHKKRKCKMCGNLESFNTKAGNSNNSQCYLGS